MKAHTEYLWFNTKKRQEFVRITDRIAEIITHSGIREGIVLVSAMHITAGVYVNDCGVRRPAPQACHRQGIGRVKRHHARLLIWRFGDWLI